MKLIQIFDKVYISSEEEPGDIHKFYNTQYVGNFRSFMNLLDEEVINQMIMNQTKTSPIKSMPEKTTSIPRSSINCANTSSPYRMIAAQNILKSQNFQAMTPTTKRLYNFAESPVNTNKVIKQYLF